MIDSSLDAVFEDKNIEMALSHLSEKKDSCGIDGIYLSSLREYWRYNKDKIISSVYEGYYEVGIIKQTDVLSRSKKRRTISTMNSVDRFLARALMQVISPGLIVYSHHGALHTEQVLVPEIWQKP